MKHYKVTFEPEGKSISIHAGASLVEAAGHAGIMLNTNCGGKGTCGKCTVIIKSTGEKVLACQYKVQSDLTVTVPAESRFYKQKILEKGFAETAKKISVDSGLAGFGIAVDIGTTTVVARLIDFKTVKDIATASAYNPQMTFGDDVISRIGYAAERSKRDKLHTAIIDCLNRLIDELCEKNDFDRNKIVRMVLVGNTTMNHLLLNFPVAGLGQIPFKPHSLEAHDVKPGDLGLHVNPACHIHTVANIAGFVGSDTVAAALAVDIEKQDKSLLVDIGTNGEIVLAENGKLYAVSCAAGPAFEGARISCGSRAVEGAVESVVYNAGDIDYDVIGNVPPRTICGSGLIDAIAVLLNLGVIETNGRYADCDRLKDKLPDAVVSRLADNGEEVEFVLFSDGSGKVSLTQKDIRETQLAKAAIRTGIRILQKKTEVTEKKLETIYLAGAFGNYINKQSAMRIGMLPNVSLEKIISVGNAAYSGAEMILLSEQAKQKAKQLAKVIEYLEIANDPDFQDIYTDSMFF